MPLRGFKGRVDRCTQLANRKCEQCDYDGRECCTPAEPDPGRKAPTAFAGACVQRGAQCAECEQHEPQPGRCAGQVPRQRQRRAQHQRCGAAAQAQARGDDQQHEEEVPQGPLRHPRTRDHIGAARVQQAPAGRQPQVDRCPVEVGLPAGHGQRVPEGDPAVGVDQRVALSYLDAGARCRARLWQPRDELLLAAHGNASDGQGRHRIQTPGARDRAADQIAGREAAAVEVEPQCAVKRELVGFRLRIAAPPLDEFQRRAGGHPEGGQALPVFRHPGLSRVQADRAARGVHRDDPQVVARGKRPDFVGSRRRQRGNGAARPSRNVDGPGAGAQLHAQRAVRLQSRRQGAHNPERDKAGQQRGGQSRLARPSARRELQARGQADRDFIVDAAVRPDGKRVGFRSGAGRFAQPELAARIGPAKRLAVASRIDQPGVGWKCDTLRQLAPGELAFDHKVAGRQAQRGPAAAFSHRHRPAIGADTARPRLGLSRQHDELVAPEDLDVQREPPSLRPDRERQPRRPDAFVAVAVVVRRRAGDRLVVLQHPRHPAAQRLRHFGLAQLGRAKLGQGHSAHPQRGADQHGREPASRLATRIGLRQQYLAGVCHSDPVHGNSSLTFKRIKKADGVGPSNFCGRGIMQPSDHFLVAPDVQCATQSQADRIEQPGL
ncbi:MAG: hypothetical protein E6H52_06110 [Betaproteobacteria bacterium]|nr:MAG: hypothetical protein E6H52_06110 [Betaproteobacteria bacterium]